MHELAKHARIPNRKAWYVCPTYRQAKSILWLSLKDRLIKCRWASKFNETDLTAFLRNGSVISLRGVDKPDALRGVGLDFVVLDEYQDIKEEAWTHVLRPTLSDTGGRALFLGTPRGYNHFFRLWDRGQKGIDPDWASWQFTTLEGGNVPPEEVEAAKKDLDDLTFQQEYLASFVNFEGRAYYPFERITHCAPLKYDPLRPLIFCYDFNVEPGVCAIIQEQRLPNGLDGTGVIGEVHIPRNSTTEAVCRRLLKDWGDHKGRVMCYGDATGGARGSAKVAGSDWEIIRSILRPHFGEQLFFKVPRENPPERTRINSVNSRLKSSAGEIRLMVDLSKAPNVVQDFEGVVLLSGGSGEIDKRHDLKATHLTDGIGYFVSMEYPITGPTAGQAHVTGLY